MREKEAILHICHDLRKVMAAVRCENSELMDNIRIAEQHAHRLKSEAVSLKVEAAPRFGQL